MTIVVGAERKPFIVHELIICASSPFFKNAMSGPWKESSEHTVDLPEDEPKVFALYCHWLYYATIPVRIEDPTKGRPGQRANKEYRELIGAYVLGDKLLDTKFQNSVIDALLETCSATNTQDGNRYYPGIDGIKDAYKKTNESSKIRSLFVDMWVSKANVNWFESADYPKEFLISVVKGLMENDPVRRSPLHASKYYVHESGNDNGNSKT